MEDKELIMDVLCSERAWTVCALDDGTSWSEEEDRLYLARLNAEIARRIGQQDGNQTLPSVTRVEVIDHSPGFQLGRAWVKWHLNDVQLSFQDNGRTLKVFVR